MTKSIAPLSHTVILLSRFLKPLCSGLRLEDSLVKLQCASCNRASLLIERSMSVDSLAPFSIGETATSKNPC